jgi:hypothetical protein
MLPFLYLLRIRRKRLSMKDRSTDGAKLKAWGATAASLYSHAVSASLQALPTLAGGPAEAGDAPVEQVEEVRAAGTALE